MPDTRACLSPIALMGCASRGILAPHPLGWVRRFASNPASNYTDLDIVNFVMLSVLKFNLLLYHKTKCLETTDTLRLYAKNRACQNMVYLAIT